MRRRIVDGLVLLSALAANAGGAEIKQTPDGKSPFVGAIGCRSSSCHGGAGEKRSQFTTWSNKDFHSRAAVILLNARSARIAEAAGITEAQSNARCTVCHSPFQSIDHIRLMPSARPDEGVSCENCHGAASSWLRGHTRMDWTYATRVAAGMRDLRGFYHRAAACVACHQNIDSELVRAGHPTLVFELDSQSLNQPKHWQDRPGTSAAGWLTGQAVALRESVWDSQTNPKSGADSHNTSDALAWLLEIVTKNDPTLPEITDSAAANPSSLQSQADQLARQAENWSPTPDLILANLRTLAATNSQFTTADLHSTDSLFYRARRLVLALERLNFALPAPLNIEKELNILRDDVRYPENFSVASFGRNMAALKAVTDQSPSPPGNASQ